MEEIEKQASFGALNNLPGGKALLNDTVDDIISNIESILYNYDKPEFNLIAKIAETKAKYEIVDKIVGSNRRLEELKKELKENVK